MIHSRCGVPTRHRSFSALVLESQIESRKGSTVTDSEVTIKVISLPHINSYPEDDLLYDQEGTLATISRDELSRRAEFHRISIEDRFADAADHQIEHFSTLENEEALDILRDMVDSFIHDPLHFLSVPESSIHQLGDSWVCVLHPLTENTTPPPVRDLEDVTKYYWYHLLCADLATDLKITSETVSLSTEG